MFHYPGLYFDTFVDNPCNHQNQIVFLLSCNAFITCAICNNRMINMASVTNCPSFAD